MTPKQTSEIKPRIAEDRVNRTRMTRMWLIFADILFVLSAPIHSDLCHPRSIPILQYGAL
jgi:hypothetical protein